MPTPQDDPLIRQWSKRFRKDPLAAGAIADLSGRGDEIWQHAFELLRRESPEYRNAIDDEFTRESKIHCNELLRTIVAIATGRAAKSGDVFAFVRAHAEWRARHGVPLIASLHAYRLAHRTYSGLTRAPLLAHSETRTALLSMTMLSDFWIELFDHVGAMLAEAHAVVERMTAAQNTHAYTALIDSLLRGQPPTDAEGRRLCALCGIRAGTLLAVAILRQREGSKGSTIDRDAALRSLMRLLDETLPHASFGKLITARSGEVTAIICSDKGGRGAIEALRRNGFVRRTTDGSTADVGVSRDTTEIVQLPAAVEEARLAADFTRPSQPIMHFSDIDLAEYLIRRADDVAFRLVPDWARRFGPDEDAQSQELRRTIRAFADCNLNVKQTARRVGVHINTVYFRLNRIKKLTGVDPRTYSGTVFLLTALRLQEVGDHRKQIH
jgi:PucR C-terminal helix-turn-helix domain